MSLGMSRVEKNCSIIGINLEAVCTGHNINLGEKGAINCASKNSGGKWREQIKCEV